MQRPIALAGPVRIVVYAVCANGTSSPGFDFYQGLEDKDKAKILTLFKQMAEFGRIANRERFKKIEGTDFFEFKNFQTRMPCFMLSGGLVVITHGFRKQKDRIDPAQID